MAVEVISKIKQKNNRDFKIADACDIEYSNPKMDSMAESQIDSVSDALDAMFDILNTDPSLAYVEDEGFQ